MRKLAGFGMVEVVLIAAVIVILTAVLWPVFAPNRHGPPQLRCVNNQKSFATAVQIYTQEHEETLPPAATFWGDLRVDKAALQCNQARKKPNGYGYNSFIGGYKLGEIAAPAQPEKLADPTNILLTADSDNPTNMLYSRSDFAPRHNGKFVASYLDGHVDMPAGPHDPQIILSVVKITKLDLP